MDRNLHTDDFERLLREKSNEFRMYPSKRIWYSIYNNIHPGRKWPSVAMSIVLITSLLLIGYLNSNNHSDTNIPSGAESSSTRHMLAAKRILPEYQYKPFAEYTGNEVGKYSPEGNLSNPDITHGSEVQGGSTLPTILSTLNRHGAPDIAHATVVAADGLSERANTAGHRSPGVVTNPAIYSSSVNTQNHTILVAAALVDDNNRATLTGEKRMINVPLNTVVSNELPGRHGINVNESLTTVAVTGKPLRQIAKTSRTLSAEDNYWIENYALYNRPVPKKWAGKLKWELYATPSVVYRTLSTNPAFGITSNTAPFVIPSTNNVSNDVIQKPSLGLEVGTGIRYPIFKGVHIKTGIQLNFTRYNSHGFHNAHPVSTKLTMHDYETNSTYDLFRTTPYSNKAGVESIKLHNETYQVSIPVGVDVKLLGNEYLQWNVGVTMQPTFLLGAKSYLLSSDRRNYVKENSMLNRWNLNAGFETFLSYKSNGITYQVGPQFRKQVFSTNNKEFAIEERLVNYGVKFGIVKTIK